MEGAAGREREVVMADADAGPRPLFPLYMRGGSRGKEERKRATGMSD